MIFELLIGSAMLGGGYFASKTRAGKAVLNGIKNYIVRNKVGKGYLLSNAANSISEELENNKQKLIDEETEINAEQRELNRKKETLSALKFGMDDNEFSEQDKKEFRIEYESLSEEIQVIESNLDERIRLLEESKLQLKEYEDNEYKIRLKEANHAKVKFEQDNILSKSENNFRNISKIGEGSMTSKAINSVSIGPRNTISVGSKQRLLRKYQNKIEE